jgi:hypothetical protein
MSQIIFEGSTQIQAKLKALVREFIDVFATKVRKEPAAVEPMKSRRRYESKLMHSWNWESLRSRRPLSGVKSI